jgi:hypothetical protein
MSDPIRDGIKVLIQLQGPCSFCNGSWHNHKLVNGKKCFGKEIDDAIHDIEQVIDNGELPQRCPICGCGRYGCMNDHGYGGPGPED